MISANTLKKVIGFKTVSKFHQVNTAKGIFSLLTEWCFIITLVVFCEAFFSWPLYVLCLVIIGARYLALGLIMHEGVHGLITTNRKVNDIVSELFCAWPLFISMRSYRVKHLAHHAWLNTDKDPDHVAKVNPDWQYPMRFVKFIKIAISQLVGIGVFETFRVMSSSQMKSAKKNKTPLSYQLFRVLFYSTIITTFVLLDKGMILLWYWIIPFATWTQFANRMRRVAEHSGIEGKPHDMQTRTTTHGLLVRLLLSPKNISYHNEHHLYPGVPCYNLPKLHNEIISIPEVKESLHISNSYKNVFDECIVTEIK
jgi:fatty acid desaturase